MSRADHDLLGLLVAETRDYAILTLDVEGNVARKDGSRFWARVVRGQLGSALNAATECSFVGTDLDGKFTVFDAGAERMLGYRAEEMIGIHTPALIDDASEIAARAAELGIAPGFEVFVAAARQGRVRIEKRYLRPDGRVVWKSSHASTSTTARATSSDTQSHSRNTSLASSQPTKDIDSKPTKPLAAPHNALPACTGRE
ncbi:MAG: PAS domain S-box protein [Solirubrobacteraceae bacterium]